MKRMVYKVLLCLFLVTRLTSAFSQNNFNFYISNYGNDTNAGTSALFPKKSISIVEPFALGSANSSIIPRIGLKQGHQFNERLTPEKTVNISSYADTGSLTRYAILSGSEKFDKGWLKVEGYANSFFQSIFHFGFPSTLGYYDYLYVIEIDVEMEKVAPISARKLLQYTSSISQMDTIAGSFFEFNEAKNPLNVYVHTSDGKSPNNHGKYRYEVSVRSRAIDAYGSDNNKFENIWARGYGSGYGLLPSGSNSIYKNIIFGPGAGIHHIVIKDGSLENCLFFPAAKYTNEFAVVFYNAEGYKAKNSIYRCMFLDIPKAIYSHKGFGQNYNRLNIAETYFFGNNDTYCAIGLSDTDSLILNKVNVDKAYLGYNGSAKVFEIKDSYFNDIGYIGMTFPNDSSEATISNVFVKSETLASNFTGIFLGNGLDLRLTNSIIDVNSRSKASNSYAFLAANRENYAKLKATKNIFIADVDSTSFVFGGTTTNVNGVGASRDVWDNNVYILYGGSKIFWNTTKYSQNNFEAWQAESGQDQNSLYLDIRNDPRGLKSIFIDPENGNYELANTVYGNRIKKTGAGMLTPPVCFMDKPSYERAAEMNQSNSLPAINSCRQPCQKTSVQIKAGGSIENGILNVCQGEQLIFEGKGIYRENGKNYTQIDNASRFLWWTSDEKDTAGLYLNTVKKVFAAVGNASVKLQMVDINGCTADTTLLVNVRPAPAKPMLGNDTFLCNGQNG